MDYCDIEWFALAMNRDHSVIFEIVSRIYFEIISSYTIILSLKNLEHTGHYLPKSDKFIIIRTVSRIQYSSYEFSVISISYAATV